MRRLFAWCLVLSMLLMLPVSLAEQAPEKVFRTLYRSEVSTLNYLTAGRTGDQTVGANVVDTLVEYDAAGKVIPGLAETWENSEDQLTWTFHLRRGQQWLDHQGNEKAEVTAQDFVDGLRYVLTAANESGVAYAVSTAHILNGDAYYNGEVTDFEQVGVKAIDAYTLQYTLDRPIPYFLSCLTYGSFMPVYGPMLEEAGEAFGTAADKMYYNGAFILSEFEPQVKHVYIKNHKNWDAQNVKLDRIVKTYNAEANTLSPTMAIRGEVDYAELSNDIVEDFEAQNGNIVTRERIMPDFSYFFAFNFNPTYDAEYGPDNWRIAVNNTNFRHAIMSAFNRLYALSATESNDPESLILNTITPGTFSAVNDTDFTRLPPFDGVEDNFYVDDLTRALAYKEKAMEELTAAGATFPVQVVLTYKSGDSNWENECILVEEMLESALGTDFIDVILYSGPSESFLSATRRAGVYSLMKCNWGADYADPETWTDPFVVRRDGETNAIIGNSYNKMDLMLDSDFEETKAILVPYYAAVAEAKEMIEDTAKRYDLFAKAERMLVDHAIVIPYSMSPAGYIVSKLDVFQGAYAPFGMSNLRYKHQELHGAFITFPEYEKSREAWQEAVGL